MNRRNFLGTTLLGGAAAILKPELAIGQTLPPPLVDPFPGPTVFAGMSAPVGCGIPNAYPLSICGGCLDRAYLYPFSAQLYDSEIVHMLTETMECDGGKLMFFNRPVSQEMLCKNIIKDLSDTNLNQSEILDYPREFSVTGVGVFLEYGVSEEDRAAIINNGTLQFCALGNRPYVTVPLMLMPHFCDAASMAEAEAEATPVLIGKEEVERLTRVRAGFYPLRIREEHGETTPKEHSKDMAHSAFRLKPGERFFVMLKWDRALKLSRPVKIMVALDGYLWQPI